MHYDGVVRDVLGSLPLLSRKVITALLKDRKTASTSSGSCTSVRRKSCKRAVSGAQSTRKLDA